MQTHEAREERGRAAPTPPTIHYPRKPADPLRRARSRTGPVRGSGEPRAAAVANTPWGLWTAAEGTRKDNVVSQATLTTILEESMREWVGREISQRVPSDFVRKAWMQSDKTIIAWVTACRKEHIGLNPRQFPVVVPTDFGARQHCLKGLKGIYIRQKAGVWRKNQETKCDAYGENLVKATLPGAGWTINHDAINIQVHRIARQS